MYRERERERERERVRLLGMVLSRLVSSRYSLLWYGIVSSRLV